MTIDVTKFGNVGVLIDDAGIERVASTQMGQSILQTLKGLGLSSTELRLDKSLSSQLEQQQIHRVFLAVPGKYGEDGCVQGMLDILQLPYTGSGVFASALAIDKARCKDYCRSFQIQTPNYQVIDEQNWRAQTINWDFPVVVKAISSGSSIGVYYVDSAAGLEMAIRQAAELNLGVMIEQYISGDAYTVSVISGKALPPVHVEFDQPIYDFAAKYENSGSKRGVSSRLSPDQQLQLQTLAEKIYEKIGFRGCVRMDFMCDRNHEFWFLEANTNPFLCEGHGVAVAAKAASIGFDDLILNILSETLEGTK